MAELTKERLTALSNRENVGAICGDEIAAMARQLLTGMEQEPVHQACKEAGVWVDIEPGDVDSLKANGEQVRALYAAPQLPQLAVPDALDDYVNSDEHPLLWSHNKGWNACRAAMLQGAEPVIQPDELPMDYLQGHKDGLEWAARLAEANHPQTGDWLYDDPLELAKAIRKGPDMPGEPVQKLTFREALAAIRNLGPIDAEKIQAERDALNEPDVPDGYALVPVDPTEKMIIEGFESVPHPLFQPADWDKYQTMSGCEQAAHRAKLCWAAMIKAAPKP